MAISKLTIPQYVDGSSKIYAADLNAIISKVNELVDAANGSSSGGGSSTPTDTYQYFAVNLEQGLYAYENSTNEAVLVDASNNVIVTLSGTSGEHTFTESEVSQIKKVGIKSGNITLTPKKTTVYEYTQENSYQFIPATFDEGYYEYIAEENGDRVALMESGDTIVTLLVKNGNSNFTLTSDNAARIARVRIYKGKITITKIGTPLTFSK